MGGKKRTGRTFDEECSFLVGRCPLPVAIVDGKGFVRHCNPSFALRLGLAENDVVGALLERHLQEYHPARLLSTQPLHVLRGRGGSWVCRLQRVQLEGDLELVLFEDLEVVRAAEDLLVRQEAVHERSLRVIDALFVSLDPQGRVRTINPAGCRILGYRPEEVIGKGWLENFVPKEYRKEVSGLFAKIVARQFPDENYYENPVLTREGKLKHIQWHNLVLRDEKGGVAAVLASGVDVTKRWQVQEDLLDRERLFRGLFENANDAIFILERGRFIDCNDRALALFGAARDEVIGKTPQHFSVPVQEGGEPAGEGAKRRIEAALQDQRQRFEWRHQRKGGAIIDVEVCLSRLVVQGRALLLAIVRDVTDRKRAQEALRQSRDQLAGVIDSVTHFIVAVDQEGIVTSWNRAVAAYTGVRAQRAVGSPLSSLSGSAQSMVEALLAALSSTEPVVKELRLFDAHGNSNLFVATTTPMRGAQGLVVGAVLTARPLGYHQQSQAFVPGEAHLCYEDDLSTLVEAASAARVLERYRYVCVSRTNPALLRSQLPKGGEVLLFATTPFKGVTVVTEASGLAEAIQKVLDSRPALVIVDRLDFLVTLSGFEQTLQALYRLHDAVAGTKHILVVNTSRECLTDVQRQLLEREFSLLPAARSAALLLADEKYAILLFVSSRNQAGMKVSFTQVGGKFGLARMTAKKYLGELLQLGFLRVEREGRSKFVYLTAQGADVLKRRQPASLS